MQAARGPFITTQEVEQIKDSKSYLRHELQYQKLAHPKDALYRPELYKVNALSSEQMVANLCCLLGPNKEEVELAPVFFL